MMKVQLISYNTLSSSYNTLSSPSLPVRINSMHLLCVAAVLSIDDNKMIQLEDLEMAFRVWKVKFHLST